MDSQLQKMYEMMGKLNPDFKLNEALPTLSGAVNTVKSTIGNAIDRANNVNIDDYGNYRLKTYGDLKKAINVIQLKNKGAKLSGQGIDALIGAIPVLGSAKTIHDLLSAAINKPDTKKTNTWLDKLDIDDDTSKIVDDTVEQGFLKYMVDKINSTSDEKPLENDFNMNNELSEYLKGAYNNRTIIGYQ